MKVIKTIISVSALWLFWLFTAALINPTAAVAPKNKAVADKGFAVVELFTSEGCSSCPAADAVIAKIEKETAGRPVYILAYHVDYWNRLGWKDVFSSAEYSRRQNLYANRLKLSSVYTPQVIVNGQSEFVGSKEAMLRSTITANISKEPKARLALKILAAGHEKASFSYDAAIGEGNYQLLVALVQKHAATVVKSGENGGRTLQHVQIVTKLQSIDLKSTKTGEERLNLPKNYSAANYELIGFIQNTLTGEITGAARAVFPDMAVAGNE